MKFPSSGSPPSDISDVNDVAMPVGANADKFELTYDKLVIAVGAYNQSASRSTGRMHLAVACMR